MSMSYKSVHEQFVSNLSGTSIWEVQGIWAVTAGFIILRSLISESGLRWTHSYRWSFFLDLILCMLPPLLCLTLFSELWSWAGVGAVCLIAGMCVLLLSRPGTVAHQGPLLDREMATPSPAITNVRGSLLVNTAIAILAVDFQVFPRRFGKAETYGTGLMDVGVGAFTAMLGLTAREARTAHPTHRSLGDKLKNVAHALQSSLPLLVCGVLRLLSVKSVDYHEHVTEYGTHWNFFFTLATVRVMCAVVSTVVPPTLSWVLAAAAASGYQYLLSNHGLSSIMLHGFHGDDGRHGFLEANREGVFSCMGYFSVYWVGVYLGQRFFLEKRKTVRDWLLFVVELLILFVALNVCLWLSEVFVSPISRRLSNLPYNLWVAAMMVQILGLFTLGEIIRTLVSSESVTEEKTRDVRDGGLLAAVNYNGLAYFLLSNILTGVINLTVHTVHASTSFAVAILSLYAFILSIISAVLYSKKIRLKFS